MTAPLFPHTSSELDRLRSALAMPGSIGRRLMRSEELPGISVIAGPHDHLASRPEPGDILLRVIEGGAGHFSLVASAGLLQSHELTARTPLDWHAPGGYVCVLDRSRPAVANLLRQITDESGRLLHDVFLLRAALFTPEEHAPIFLQSVEDAESTTTPKASACAYFFKGNRYLRYNIASDTADFGPVDIATYWTNLPAEFQSNLDASLNWGDGHVYFFKGSRYVRYNLATDHVDVGPVEISTYWSNLPAEFQGNLDAAVNWGDGHAYFFKGARYLRYNIASDSVDVPAVEIARNWPGLPAEFQFKIDSAVNWGNGNVYFFKGARYVRYNIAADNVDVGPVEISRYWTGLPAEFQSGAIRAAVNWTFPGDLAGIMRAAGLAVNEVGNWRNRFVAGTFTPIGIMMHHTGGTNSLPIIVNGNATLAGPRANFHVEKSGVINIVSPGPANHAGPGAQTVLDEVATGTAPSGTAAHRGLHDSISGNRFFYGFENENRGDGSDPWPEEQLSTMATAAAALCRRHCWNTNRTISHKEWTSRKPVDPAIDMNAFRARVGRLL